MASSTSNDQSSVKRRRYQYTYTALDNLPRDGKVNVYGVIKFTKHARVTKSGGYCKTIGIYNSTLYANGEKFMIIMFANMESELPDCEVGDIIRLHRLQMDMFHNQPNGKLQIRSGGTWTLFDVQSDGFTPTASSCKDPIITQEEEEMVTNLRQWIKTEQPGDSIEDRNIQPIRGGVISSSTPAGTATYVCIESITPDSFATIRCQLLQRSVLRDNDNKLVILTVWDGTKIRLDLNIANLADFDSHSHECGVLDQLPEYCVHLVLYGDHVKRAKQLKLGGLYAFPGIHCKEYTTVGKPELYLHESYKVLAVPLAADDRETLVEHLEAAVDGVESVHIDILPDPRSTEELDKELSEMELRTSSVCIKKLSKAVDSNIANSKSSTEPPNSKNITNNNSDTTGSTQTQLQGRHLTASVADGFRSPDKFTGKSISIKNTSRDRDILSTTPVSNHHTSSGKSPQTSSSRTETREPSHKDGPIKPLRHQSPREASRKSCERLSNKSSPNSNHLTNIQGSSHKDRTAGHQLSETLTKPLPRRSPRKTSESPSEKPSRKPSSIPVSQEPNPKDKTIDKVSVSSTLSKPLPPRKYSHKSPRKSSQICQSLAGTQDSNLGKRTITVSEQIIPPHSRLAGQEMGDRISHKNSPNPISSKISNLCHYITKTLLYAAEKIPEIARNMQHHDALLTKKFLDESVTLPNSDCDSDLELDTDRMVETPYGHNVMRDEEAICRKFGSHQAVPIVLLRGNTGCHRSVRPRDVIMKYRYDNHLLENIVAGYYTPPDPPVDYYDDIDGGNGSSFSSING